MDYQQLAPPAPLPAPAAVQLPHVHMLQQQQQHMQQMQHISGAPHQNLPPVHFNEADPRWSQYQQFLRQHHTFVNNNNTIGINAQAANVNFMSHEPDLKWNRGKSSANSTGSSKGDCDSHSGSSAKDKDSDCSEGGLWGNVEAQAAFLGPNIWDKTLPYDADLKYVDLDEFLSENGIPVDGMGHSGGLGSMGHLGGLGGSHRSEALGHPLGGMPTHLTKIERSPSPSECMSPDTMNPASPADSTFSMASSGRDFDPRTRAFSDEELKPQPMIKKSRKQVQASTSDFVPDNLKDDKYWARRRKNNMAAKRSRDARRMKENQIALRAGYLEKENIGLRQELERIKKENMMLRDKLSKFTDV